MNEVDEKDFEIYIHSKEADKKVKKVYQKIERKQQIKKSEQQKIREKRREIAIWAREEGHTRAKFASTVRPN